MMRCGFQLFILGAGLAIGNFAYEVFGAMNWSRAIEHAWFNTTALLAAWLVLRFIPVRPVSPGE